MGLDFNTKHERGKVVFTQTLLHTREFFRILFA